MSAKQVLDTALMLAPFIEQLSKHIHEGAPPPIGLSALPSTLKSEIALKRAEARKVKK